MSQYEAYQRTVTAQTNVFSVAAQPVFQGENYNNSGQLTEEARNRGLERIPVIPAVSKSPVYNDWLPGNLNAQPQAQNVMIPPTKTGFF